MPLIILFLILFFSLLFYFSRPASIEKKIKLFIFIGFFLLVIFYLKVNQNPTRWLLHHPLGATNDPESQT